jgi:hypothetical protein
MNRQRCVNGKVRDVAGSERNGVSRSAFLARAEEPNSQLTSVIAAERTTRLGALAQGSGALSSSSRRRVTFGRKFSADVRHLRRLSLTWKTTDPIGAREDGPAA